MSMEIPRPNSGHDKTLDRGEPTAILPDGYVDAYRESLRALGVCEEDAQKCASYMQDESARASRHKTDGTVDVGGVVSESQAFDRASRITAYGRHITSQKTNGSLNTVPIVERNREVHTGAARQRRIPLLQRIRGNVETIASVVGITIEPIEHTELSTVSIPTTEISHVEEGVVYQSAKDSRPWSRRSFLRGSVVGPGRYSKRNSNGHS